MSYVAVAISKFFTKNMQIFKQVLISQRKLLVLDSIFKIVFIKIFYLYQKKYANNCSFQAGSCLTQLFVSLITSSVSKIT